MRILYVVKNMRLSNGVASYAMNYYRNIKDQVQRFDFLIVSDVGSPYYEEIENDGNYIYYMPSYKKEPYKIVPFLKKLYRDNQYDIVHCHVVNSGSLILMEAKRQGIPVRILHSHATKSGDKKWKEIRNRLFRSLSLRYANHYFACSCLAGDYLFGHKDYTVINNAINLEKYGFKEEYRQKIRNEMKCDNKVIIGTVGRMTTQKNPFFIVEIIKALKDKSIDFEFWWFGDGELEDKIKAYAEELNVLDSIRFFGACKTVCEYYSGMDIFILPSIYEGLPVVGIEAQTSGLPSLFSDKVTKEVAISDGVDFIPIESPIQWADVIMSFISFNRKANIASLKLDQYQIEAQSRMLVEKYKSLLHIG